MFYFKHAFKILINKINVSQIFIYLLFYIRYALLLNIKLFFQSSKIIQRVYKMRISYFVKL